MSAHQFGTGDAEALRYLPGLPGGLGPILATTRTPGNRVVEEASLELNGQIVFTLAQNDNLPSLDVDVAVNE